MRTRALLSQIFLVVVGLQPHPVRIEKKEERKKIIGEKKTLDGFDSKI